MSRIVVLYYTHSGNTEKMARAVAEGAKMVPGTIVEIDKSYVLPEELTSSDAVLIGVPTYYANMPDDSKNFFDGLAKRDVNLKGKIGAVFGSFGWSGEAPGQVVDLLKNRFGMTINDPPLLVKETPDQVALGKCRELGKKIAEGLTGKS